jgi:hypothetical protein
MLMANENISEHYSVKGCCMGEQDGLTILDLTSGAVRAVLDYLYEVKKRLDLHGVPSPNLRIKAKHAVILGEPWTGKTTYLRNLSCQWAQEAESTLHRYGTARVKIPIFIPLKTLKDSDEELEEAIIAFVKWEYRRVIEQHSSCFVKLLKQKLQDGHCNLLLDGLEQVSSEQKRGALRRRLCHFAANNPCPFRLTSRLEGYKRLDESTSVIAEIILPGHIDAERSRWLRHVAQAPDLRLEVINYLVDTLGHRLDDSERYWIYITLGEIATQTARGAERRLTQEVIGEARWTEQKGSLAHRGAREALKILNGTS